LVVLSVVGGVALSVSAALAAPAGESATVGESTSGEAVVDNTAARYQVVGLRPISAPSPFPGGCPGAFGDAQRISGAELEPMITVNRTNPRNIIATWQQDVGFAARADLVAASRDGGRTWKRTVMRGTSCTHGRFDAASDPWISAGPRGSVYFVGVPAFLPEPPRIAIVAEHSSDGGRTWPTRRWVTGADIRNDKPAITAHPTRFGRAYVTWWSRDVPVTVPSTSFLRFARTTDGGATWSHPVVVDHAPPNAVNFSGQVLVLPKAHGTLVTVFARLSLGADGSVTGQLFATRSRDDGRTWGKPVLVVSTAFGDAPRDPETGLELNSQDVAFFSAAAGADGSMYVAWDSDRSATSGSVKFVSSLDGGRSWTAPASLPGVTAFTMQPAIAVTPSGTVGVLWYDTRHDRLGDQVLTTDVWFAHSNDHGAHWRQAHVAGPFDFRRAPGARLGEYQGLAALGRRSFAAAFTQARPQARSGPTDIFFARMEPARGAGPGGR
jgi:hypothetical protein